MGLSVRPSRCAAISMIISGFLILILAGAYIAFSLIFGHPVYTIWTKPKGTSLMEFVMLLSWRLGYTSLLALITMVAGCIGCCASGHRSHRDMCLIVTLFIFSLIVAGLSAYTIYDFSIIIWVAKKSADTVMCIEGFCLLIFRSVEATLLGFAILVLLVSSWAIICCIASCCCHTEVEPEPMPTQQRQQRVMTQGGAVMIPMMRTDTAVPVMLPSNPGVEQATPIAPVNQVSQPQTQTIPMIACQE